MFADAQDQLFHNSGKFPGCPMLKSHVYANWPESNIVIFTIQPSVTKGLEYSFELQVNCTFN